MSWSDSTPVTAEDVDLIWKKLDQMEDILLEIAGNIREQTFLMRNGKQLITESVLNEIKEEGLNERRN